MLQVATLTSIISAIFESIFNTLVPINHAANFLNFLKLF